MDRFSNILFSPLGDSGNVAALRRVAELVNRNGARVTLLGVVAEPPRSHVIAHRVDFFEQVTSSECDRRRDQLTGWASKYLDGRAEVVVTVGNPALEIIHRVLAAGHDLVVVTSDEDREDHATIKRLLRKCPCPVWVIRPKRVRVQRVLAAVNPEPAEAELNEVIVELAASISSLRGGELHVVHAWELYGESTLRSSAFYHLEAPEIEQLLDEERDAREHAVEKLLVAAGVASAPWKIHVRKGPPAEVVATLVARLNINLLVMGTVARSGISGLLMGNTAERVLDDVRCSVIAVKPPGFVSPLAAE